MPADTEEAAKLESITLEELRSIWPKSEDGKLCARLLKRYALTLLIDTALGAECTTERAVAEASAHKTMAKMAKDFGTFASDSKAPDAAFKLPGLKRFQPAEKPAEPEKT